MKLVRPTNPPSMAVIVDPIVVEITTLSIAPADNVKVRIDTIYASKGMVGVLRGMEVYAYPMPPPPPPGTRRLANIYLPRAITAIFGCQIEEME